MSSTIIMRSVQDNGSPKLIEELKLRIASEKKLYI